jgi:uncharacterized membrane protein
MSRGGYTAGAKVGQKPAMALTRQKKRSPLAPLIVVLVLLLAGLFFLSTLPEEVPTRTIEAEVTQAGNAQ